MTKKLVWSEKSAMPFPAEEMVYEKGTGLYVHRSEDDSNYNWRTHPQLTKIRVTPERPPNIPSLTPDYQIDPPYIELEDGTILEGDNETYIGLIE